jgi:DNA-directed RNA polymerase specialized sigma24 family protein
VMGQAIAVGDDEIDEGMTRVLSSEPTPEVAAQLAEDYQRLLDKLEDATLKNIALRRLEGHSREEIAAQLGTSVRTVDRKLILIRLMWQEELSP